VAFGSGPGRCPYRLRYCLGDSYRMPIPRDRAVTRAEHAGRTAGDSVRGPPLAVDSGGHRQGRLCCVPLAHWRIGRLGVWGRRVCWLGASAMILWGGVNTVVGNLVLGGAIRPDGGYDRAGMIATPGYGIRCSSSWGWPSPSASLACARPAPGARCRRGRLQHGQVFLAGARNSDKRHRPVKGGEAPPSVHGQGEQIGLGHLPMPQQA